jgi:hypothetical protein
MVLSVVAVGEQYINNCLPYLDKFKNNGYDIKILTDKPEKFIGYDTQLYENKIFSYFDKLLFSLRLVEKYKTDVLYIDSDWIQNVNDVFIKNFNGSNNVLYYDNWENDLFINYINDFYWKDLLFYFNLYKIDHLHLKLPLEWIFYFPNIDNVSQVLFDLEKIKPIFDWISTVVPSQYNGNGNGEGLGLSHVLDKNNIELIKFNKWLFKGIKENKKII